jgi:hypothetical protein
LRFAARCVAVLGAVALGGCSAATGAAAGAWGALVVAGLNDANPYEIPDSGPYFFHGTGQGTDATAGPFDVVLNKGYATAQWEGFGRHIFDHPYGWSRTWRSISHLNEAMEYSGGWGRTLRVNVVPGSEEGWRTWAWVPNYFGHVVEGGIAYRRLKEWAEWQGIGHAGLFAGAVTWGAAFINEAYEAPDPGPPHGGTTLDLLFFDIGGILLFESDRVSRFFSRNLRASIWPTQASLLVNDGRLMNNGHHLVLKLPFLGITDRVSFFLKAGVGFAGGLAIHRPDGLDITVGVGAESKIRFIDPTTRLVTSEFGPAGGIWIDRRGVLLASLLIEPHTDRVMGLNVYPGVIPFLRDFGAWVNFDDHDRWSFGLTHRQTMGLGLGVGF